MGNSNWADTAMLSALGSYEHWERIGFDQDHQVLRNSQTGQQCEQYYVVPRCQRTHEAIMQEYALRSRQEGNVVRVLHAARADSLALCSGTDQYRVWTERIPWRLDDLADLELQESLYLIVEAAYGYLVLHEHGKELIVSARAIGITPGGKVRVWTNEYFAADDQSPFKFQHEHTRANRQAEIVQALFDTVRQHTYGLKYPQRLETKIATATTFESALNVVYDYSKEAKLRLSNCLTINQPRTHLRTPRSPQSFRGPVNQRSEKRVISPPKGNKGQDQESTTNSNLVINALSSPPRNKLAEISRSHTKRDRSTSKQPTVVGNVQLNRTNPTSTATQNSLQSKTIIFKQRKQQERDLQATSKNKEYVPYQVMGHRPNILNEANKNLGANNPGSCSPLSKNLTVNTDVSFQSPSKEILSPVKKPQGQPEPQRTASTQERVNHLMTHHNFQILPKEQYLKQSRSISRSSKTPSKVTFTFFNSRQLKTEEETMTAEVQGCISVPTESKENMKELAEQPTRTATPRASEDVVKSSLIHQPRESVNSNLRKFEEDSIIETESRLQFPSEKPRRAASPVEALNGLSTLEEKQPTIKITQCGGVRQQPSTTPVTFQYCKLYSRTVNSFLYNGQVHEPLKYFDRHPYKNSGHETGIESNIVRREVQAASDPITDIPTEEVTIPRFLRLQTQVDKMCSSFTKESFLSQKTTRQSNIQLVAKLFPGLPTHESQLASSLEQSYIEQNLDSLNERHKQGAIYESRQA